MEKAAITAYNVNTRKTEGEKFSVLFNPATYSVAHSNKAQVNYNNKSGGGWSLHFTYLTKAPSTLSVELVFDSYDQSKGSQQANVRERYAPLRAFLAVQAEGHAPPVVLFAWGKVAFVGYIVSLDETFTMFSDGGTPVRAKVKLRITGCTKEDLKTVVTHSPDRTKICTVSQGDTIWAIAEREYGSPELWRPIADANGIHNPRRIIQASQLTIPALTEGRVSGNGKAELG